ncbi:MAG: type II toxin-antitoxin system mRNA interferase toxin, RelE/StbE family [Deltaproteobacteria bacterium]|nr:type II toxin-antitoxin system mRNA interferase toxin, RelE/StbE family [Deltaproteobacteria bacterium]
MRSLIWTGAFTRDAKRLLKKRSVTDQELEEILRQMEDDPFDPLLETHKLKGKLSGSWACSLGYDYRIVFDFVTQPGSKTKDLLLLAIGTHDEVY